MPICPSCQIRFEAGTASSKCKRTWILNRNSYEGLDSFINRILFFAFMAIVLAILLWIGGRNVFNYLKEAESTLIALDAAKGQIVWSKPFGNSFARSTIAHQNQVSVVRLTDLEEDYYQRYQIDTFDSATGRRRWTFHPPSEPYIAEAMAGIPLVAEGETLWAGVLLEQERVGQVTFRDEVSGRSIEQAATLRGISQGKVIALNAATGQPRWAIDRDWSTGGFSSYQHLGVVASGDRSVILRVTPEQKVLLEARDTLSGKQLWQIQVGQVLGEPFPLGLEEAQFLSNIFINGCRLFASSENVFLLDESSGVADAYDWQTGRLEFQVQGIGLLSNLFVMKSTVSGSTLYSFDSLASTLKAVDAGTGIRRWTFAASGFTQATAVTDGIYLASQNQGNQADSQLLFLDAKTGRERWSKQISDGWLAGNINDVNNEILVSGSEAVFAIVSGQNARNDRVLAWTSANGNDLWQWMPKSDCYISSLSSAGDRVFVLARVPRWRNLTGAIAN